MDSYCLSCKRFTSNKNITEHISKNNKKYIKSECVICNKGKSLFIKSNKVGGDIVSALDNGLKKFGLHGLPELHLPGHQFTGPGTNLEKRLNPATDEPWEWSRPINRVDETALHHDKCYRDADKGKGSRNKCDKVMTEELNSIKNPTMRERIDLAIVKPIIYTKQKLGLGLKKTKLKL